METEEYYAAIDLGSSKITGVVAQKMEDGRFNFIACEQVESKYIRRGEVKNTGEIAFKINEIIRKLNNNRIFRENKHEIQRIYVGLGGYTLRTRSNVVKRILGADDEVSEELIAGMLGENFKIKIEGCEIYEAIEQEYLVDDEWEFCPVGMSCSNNIQGHYQIIYGKPELRKNLLRSFEKANQLDIAGMYLAPIAMAEAILTNSEKEMGCVAVDFGADTTSVCVYYNGFLRHVAVIPFGGSGVTNDIKDLNVTQQVAERLKLEFGNAMAYLETDDKTVVIPDQEGKTVSTAFLASIIEARVNEILAVVWNEVEKSKFADRLGAGFVITGGASRLKNIDELIKFKFGHDVRYGDLRWYVEPTSKFVNMVSAQLMGLLLLADEPCTIKKVEAAVVDEGVAAGQPVSSGRGTGGRNGRNGKKEKSGKLLTTIITGFEKLFDLDSDAKMD